MSRKKVAKTIWVTPDQHEKLAALPASASALMREAVDAVIVLHSSPDAHQEDAATLRLRLAAAEAKAQQARTDYLSLRAEVRRSIGLLEESLGG